MIHAGDRVRYTAKWLRSTGNQTGDLPFARGTVLDIVGVGPDLYLAEVIWDDPDIPPRVRDTNLEMVSYGE